jgi:diphthamide synthase subunit DPH2
MCNNVQVGTLACAGFQSAINMVRRQAKLAGKKTYTFVMGKPNPSKLGNFREVSFLTSMHGLPSKHLDKGKLFCLHVNHVMGCCL